MSIKEKHIYIILCLFLCSLIYGCKSADLIRADSEYNRGVYFEAQKSYREIYNSLNKKSQKEKKSYVAFQLGKCYANLNQPAKASNYFLNAIRYGSPDSTIYLFLGQSLIKQGKLKDAEKYLTEYLKYNPESESGKMAILNVRNELYNNKTRYVIKESKFINGRRSDYSPAFIMGDFDIIYYTTTNEQVAGSVRSGITGMKNGDIWMVRKNEHGKWLKPEPIDGNVNSEHDEGIISFSSDGNTMYLTRSTRSSEKDTHIEIWVSKRSNAQWNEPVKMDFDTDSLSNYGHPSISPDGKFLYLSSDRPGGYGGFDIWRMNLLERGAKLENLGSEINSTGNEYFPYSKNDTTLYFASDGHLGFGGLDIYKATLTPHNSWNIENMGSPINSSYDDFGIVFGEGESGYFSSNRGDQRGYDHIYSFELPTLNILVSGYVMDPEEYIIPDAYVRIIGDNGSNRKSRVKDDGSFSFELERGINYVIQANADEYLNANQHFFTSGEDEVDVEYSVDFTLAPLNKPIVIENILYDFNKATLRQESKAALDSLAKILEEHPYITIELSSHTDRIGSDTYNDNLSLQRALSVVKYMVDKCDINPERLSYKGYGKSSPMTVTPRLAKLYPEFAVGTLLTPEFINSLESKEQQQNADQINRRTEFKITAIDFY